MRDQVARRSRAVIIPKPTAIHFVTDTSSDATDVESKTLIKSVAMAKPVTTGGIKGSRTKGGKAMMASWLLFQAHRLLKVSRENEVWCSSGTPVFVS